MNVLAGADTTPGTLSCKWDSFKPETSCIQSSLLLAFNDPSVNL